MHVSLSEHVLLCLFTTALSLNGWLTHAEKGLRSQVPMESDQLPLLQVTLPMPLRAKPSLQVRFPTPVSVLGGVLTEYATVPAVIGFRSTHSAKQNWHGHAVYSSERI